MQPYFHPIFAIFPSLFFRLTALFLHVRGIGKGLPMPMNQIFNMEDIEK